MQVPSAFWPNDPAHAPSHAHACSARVRACLLDHEQKSVEMFTSTAPSLAVSGASTVPASKLEVAPAHPSAPASTSQRLAKWVEWNRSVQPATASARAPKAHARPAWVGRIRRTLRAPQRSDRFADVPSWRCPCRDPGAVSTGRPIRRSPHPRRPTRRGLSYPTFEPVREDRSSS